MLRAAISERDIFNAVAAVRAMVQSKYDWAASRHRADWLSPIQGYRSMMTNLQAHMGRVFPPKKRDVRLRVTEALLDIDGLELTSFKDLFPSEISSLIGAFEEIDGFRLVLDALSMNPDGWRVKLAGIGSLKRPPAPAPIEEQAPAAATWTEASWEETW